MKYLIIVIMFVGCSNPKGEISSSVAPYCQDTLVVGVGDKMNGIETHAYSFMIMDSLGRCMYREIGYPMVVVDSLRAIKILLKMWATDSKTIKDLINQRDSLKYILNKNIIQ